jgi:tRNA (guanine-N7-)-methyltransferase
MPLSQRWYKAKQQHVSKHQKRSLHDLWPIYGIDLKYNQTLSLDEGEVCLDIGFGSGDSLLFSAMQHPERQHIGCEIHRAGIAQALFSLHNNSNTNTKIIRADVSLLMKHITDGALSEITVFFPDPWPNHDRDLNRRVIRPDMLASFARVLKSGGILKLGTDCEEYARYAQTLIQLTPDFTQLSLQITPAATPISIQAVPYRPITKYELKAREAGRDVWDMVFSCSHAGLDLLVDKQAVI